SRVSGDDHRRRNGPLRDERNHGPGRVPYRRHPPGVVHEVHRGACFLAGADAVSGVLLDPAAEVFATMLRKVLLTPLVVVLEAAGSQQHASPRSDADQTTLTLYDGAGDDAVLDEQLAHRRIQPELG